jgi:hypothetical protein
MKKCKVTTKAAAIFSRIVIGVWILRHIGAIVSL